MKIIPVSVLALMAFASPLAAQQGKLAPQDYIDIQQLNARYAAAIDKCTNSGYDYADLYTDDGTFAVSDDWGQAGRVFAKGREALANAAGGGPGGCRDPKAQMGYGINHILTDQIIEARPEGAYGRNKLIAMSIGGDPSKNEVQGGYEDIYVKTAKGWRIKARVHVFPNMDTSLQFGPLRKKQAEERAAQPK
jgi:hypothetical protein